MTPTARLLPDSLYLDTYSLVLTLTVTSHPRTPCLLFKLRSEYINPRRRVWAQGVACAVSVHAAATLIHGAMLPTPAASVRRTTAVVRRASVWNGCAVSYARTPRHKGLSNRYRPSRRPTCLGTKSRDVTGMPVHGAVLCVFGKTKHKAV